MSPESASRGRTRTRVLLSAPAAAACVLTCLVLKSVDGHLYFHWLWLAWAVFFASTAFLARGGARFAAAGLSGLAAALLAFELYLGGHIAALGMVPSYLSGTETMSPHSLRTGPPLGHRPAPDTRISSKRVIGGQVTYDVVYSIDENGFRRTPPLPPGTPAVVFLGDSITFGEGVDDDEAFPAVFQARSGLKAINLSYRGYGPHHLLRLLETGLDLPATARYRPVQGILLFSPDHVPRTAGSYWEPEGPRYELDAGGRPRYQGPRHGRGMAAVIGLLTKSAVVRWGWAHWVWRDPGRYDRDLQRFAAIVVEMRRVYQERYPGGFQAFFWGFGDRNSARIRKTLSERGVPVILLEEEVPEIQRDGMYITNDRHPNAALHRALGLYFARWVAARTASGSRPGP